MGVDPFKQFAPDLPTPYEGARVAAWLLGVEFDRDDNDSACVTWQRSESQPDTFQPIFWSMRLTTERDDH